MEVGELIGALPGRPLGSHRTPALLVGGWLLTEEGRLAFVCFKDPGVNPLGDLAGHRSPQLTAPRRR